jgi:hypothetical protein
MFLINTMFWKLDLFLSSGKIMGAPTLLGPLETASLNHWTDPTEYVPPSYYLRMETDPLSKTLFFLETSDMDKVKKHDSSKCTTPLSKPFRTESYVKLPIYHLFSNTPHPQIRHASNFSRSMN